MSITGTKHFNRKLLWVVAFKNRNWEGLLYVESSFPAERNTPALPISGTTKAVWELFRLPELMMYLLPVFFKLHYPIYRPKNADTKGFLEANTVDLSSPLRLLMLRIFISPSGQKWMERNARAGVRYTEFLRSHFGVSPRDDRLQRPEYVGGSKSP